MDKLEEGTSGASNSSPLSIRTICRATLGVTVAAIAMAFAFAIFAHAEESANGNECQAPFHQVAEAASAKGWTKPEEVPADKAKALVDLYNAAPPASDKKFDHVFLSIQPDIGPESTTVI